MKQMIGNLTASLIDSDIPVPANLVDKINANINPPEPVSAGDVYIRAMYIVSDEINSFGGCFPGDEYPRLIEFLVDSPVLIGHRKDSLPIARNFHAEQCRHNDGDWIKVYFYWLKNSTHGEELKKNIDAGIYKECSISFIFNLPECSICGSDIRRCGHKPFEKYAVGDDNEQTACFYYRRIEKVLETSLVYRGAVPDTSITKEMFSLEDIRSAGTVVDKNAMKRNRFRIWDYRPLDPEKIYCLMPAYESLGVILRCNGTKLSLFDAYDRPLDNPALSQYLNRLSLPPGNYSLDCRLIGYRGKERLPVSEVNKFCHEDKSSVRRLEIKICEVMENDGCLIEPADRRTLRSPLEKLIQDKTGLLVPLQQAPGSRIGELVDSFSTRYGAEIRQSDRRDRFLLTHKKLLPLTISGKVKTPGGFKYSMTGLAKSEEMPVDRPVFSGLDLNERDLVEVEVSSVACVDGCLALIHPRIIDCHGNSQRPDDISLLLSKPQTCRDHYAVHSLDDRRAILILNEKGVRSCFMIHDFSLSRLENGTRFLAEKTGSHDCFSSPLRAGVIATGETHDTCLVYTFSGALNGTFCLRTLRLNAQNRFLFYKKVSRERDSKRQMPRSQPSPNSPETMNLGLTAPDKTPKENSPHHLLETICLALDKESLAMIDFDSLKEIMTDLKTLCTRYEKVHSELELLKADYCRRTIAMIKTILSCRPDSPLREICDRLAKNPPDIDTSLLLQIHERAAAAFRSAFPSGFNHRIFTGPPPVRKNWNEYKIL
jgi:hypothetical protein